MSNKILSASLAIFLSVFILALPVSTVFAAGGGNEGVVARRTVPIIRTGGINDLSWTNVSAWDNQGLIGSVSGLPGYSDTNGVMSESNFVIYSVDFPDVDASAATRDAYLLQDAIYRNSSGVVVSAEREVPILVASGVASLDWANAASWATTVVSTSSTVVPSYSETNGVMTCNSQVIYSVDPDTVDGDHVTRDAYAVQGIIYRNSSGIVTGATREIPIIRSGGISTLDWANVGGWGTSVTETSPDIVPSYSEANGVMSVSSYPIYSVSPATVDADYSTRDAYVLQDLVYRNTSGTVTLARREIPLVNTAGIIDGDTAHATTWTTSAFSGLAAPEYTNTNGIMSMDGYVLYGVYPENVDTSASTNDAYATQKFKYRTAATPPALPSTGIKTPVMISIALGSIAVLGGVALLFKNDAFAEDKVLGRLWGKLFN